MKTWFKFYGQEFLSDPKMLSLTPLEKSLWLTILCLASASDEEGVIKHIDESKIMLLCGLSPLDDSWKETEGFLKKFETLSMITHDNGIITLTNFEKRQETNLTGYERVKRYREKKKESEAKNDDTKDNVINDNVRIEKNREEKKRIYISGATLPENKQRTEISVPSTPTGPLAETLIKKYNFHGPEKSGSSSPGITREWQEKAFRYAEKLGIELKDRDKGRWLKMFKQADEGRKAANLEKAYTYCQDHPNWFEMDNDGRMNMIFFIYENGLNKKDFGG